MIALDKTRLIGRLLFKYGFIPLRFPSMGEGSGLGASLRPQPTCQAQAVPSDRLKSLDGPGRVRFANRQVKLNDRAAIRRQHRVALMILCIRSGQISAAIRPRASTVLPHSCADLRALCLFAIQICARKVRQLGALVLKEVHLTP